jgi:8-oxo-dGTP diphosphatase
VEIIARGVCVQRGQLLVCHGKQAGNTYLPGGHVEFDERARAALERELEEELGVAASAGEFLGAVEHSFVQKGELHCEVNLVFELHIPSITPADIPVARESHIEFFWVPVDDLRAAQLEPVVLCGLLPRWLAGSPPASRWSSAGRFLHA